MTGTKHRGWTALLAGALLAFPGCVEPEAGLDWRGPPGVELQPPVNPCDVAFPSDVELTIALPLVMNRWGSSRMPVDWGWYTNALIQNTSSAPATARLRAISTAGDHYCTIFALGAGEAVTFRPDYVGAAGTIGITRLPEGNFEGSMLIETDQPLDVAVTLSNVLLDDMGRIGGTAAATYQGLSMQTGAAETGVELAYPIMKSGLDGNSTTLFVQNVEAWDDWLDLEVRTNDARVYWYSTYVPGGQSVAIHPWQLEDDGGNSMPAGCIGSASPGEPGAACIGSVRIEPYGDSGTRFGAIAVEHPASGRATAILADHFENVAPRPQ